MVNPGGTGRPMLAISARLAPLPPSRFFISFLPSALPPPKKYVRLPALPPDLPAAFLSTAVFALTRMPAWPFLWPFLRATFLVFRDLDFDFARLGMGAYLPCSTRRGKPFWADFVLRTTMRRQPLRRSGE